MWSALKDNRARSGWQSNLPRRRGGTESGRITPRLRVSVAGYVSKLPNGGQGENEKDYENEKESDC